MEDGRVDGVILFLPGIIVSLWLGWLGLRLDVGGPNHSSIDLWPCILPPSLILHLGIFIGCGRLDCEGEAVVTSDLALVVAPWPLA